MRFNGSGNEFETVRNGTGFRVMLSWEMTMTEKETMKAVQIHAFGGPEVLQYEDVPQPQPKANEIMVRVHAAGVNPVDWKIREGYLPTPLPLIMGIDFSGVVESVGSGVTKYRSGDAVFGQVA